MQKTPHRGVSNQATHTFQIVSLVAIEPNLFLAKSSSPLTFVSNQNSNSRFFPVQKPAIIELTFELYSSHSEAVA